MCGIVSSPGQPNSCNSFHGVWKGLIPQKNGISCYVSILREINTKESWLGGVF